VRLEDRGRRAAGGIHRAVGPRDAIDPANDALERFHRFRARKQRNQRIGAGLLAAAVIVATIVFLGQAFSPLERNRPAAPSPPSGLILYGDWDAKVQRADWFTVRPDGSALHRVPLQLPPGTGALNPSWSPDGTWIVFSLQRSDIAEIYMARPDGTGLRKVTGAPGAQEQAPDWGTPPR
jgi:hypothetical protein